MSFPNITDCLICEGVRPELYNKFNVLGLYGIAPYVQILVADFKMPLRICFLYFGTSVDGHFHITLQVKGPSGQVLNNRSANL